MLVKALRSAYSSLMVLMLTFGLIFCSSVAMAAETITVWCIADDTIAKFETVIALFEQQYPDINVELHPQAGTQSQVMEKIAIAIVSGASPDLVWIEGSAVVELAAQGMLMD